jgi:siroheme synthase
MARDTPAAAIQHGTTCRRQQVITTLADLPTAVAAASLASPAMTGERRTGARSRFPDFGSGRET